MDISKAGLARLIDHEGLRQKMYKDVAGYPTIAVGHLLTRSELTSGKIYIDGEWIQWRNGLTVGQCFLLLNQDVQKFVKAVNESVTVQINQNQFDALVSFAFNLGSNALKHSTLLKVVNKKQFHQATAQFKRWVYAGGKKVNGLVKRRADEAALFSKAVA